MFAKTSTGLVIMKCTMKGNQNHGHIIPIVAQERWSLKQVRLSCLMRMEKINY